MTGALLFLASFAVVFLLGIQQLNVTAGYQGAAFVTSVGISLATIAQFKVLPGPTSKAEIACYVLGCGLGIVASMRVHPAIERWLNAKPVVAQRLADIVQLEQRSLGDELAGMAATIALETAICDVESYCTPSDEGKHRWFDTSETLDDGGFCVADSVARAVRYLELRDGLVRHPNQPALVRFKP